MDRRPGPGRPGRRVPASYSPAVAPYLKSSLASRQPAALGERQRLLLDLHGDSSCSLLQSQLIKQTLSPEFSSVQLGARPSRPTASETPNPRGLLHGQAGGCGQPQVAGWAPGSRWDPGTARPVPFHPNAQVGKLRHGEVCFSLWPPPLPTCSTHPWPSPNRVSGDHRHPELLGGRVTGSRWSDEQGLQGSGQVSRPRCPGQAEPRRSLATAPGLSTGQSA